jgi:hypothetical protein
MTFGSTQTVTEISIGNLPESKGRPARKADKPQHYLSVYFVYYVEASILITLWASTACYRDSFTFTKWGEIGNWDKLQVLSQSGYLSGSVKLLYLNSVQ